ncbi:PqiC family protein [Roseovarius sp. D22-M7]|uniref:PqiC family protein n=1 Tax=Roseovarius sp. D22-M7 TaxID=3127116 RepID=UPI003010195C
MPRSLPLIALLALPFFAACATIPEERIAVPHAEIAGKQRIAHPTVALRNVTLPSYASSETIFSADATGRLRETPGILWADDPSRAMTLELVRHLKRITGARVASEPWPFLEPAAAEVEVRIEDMLARADDTFELSGQYFVTAETGRDHAHLFDLAVRIPPEATPEDLARARAAVVRDLAADIARRGLR